MSRVHLVTNAELQPQPLRPVRTESLVLDTKQHVLHAQLDICAQIMAWLQFYALQVPLL